MPKWQMESLEAPPWNHWYSMLMLTICLDCIKLTSTTVECSICSWYGKDPPSELIIYSRSQNFVEAACFVRQFRSRLCDAATKQFKTCLFFTSQHFRPATLRWHSLVLFHFLSSICTFQIVVAFFLHISHFLWVSDPHVSFHYNRVCSNTFYIWHFENSSVSINLSPM